MEKTNVDLRTYSKDSVYTIRFPSCLVASFAIIHNYLLTAPLFINKSVVKYAIQNSYRFHILHSMFGCNSSKAPIIFTKADKHSLSPTSMGLTTGPHQLTANGKSSRLTSRASPIQKKK